MSLQHAKCCLWHFEDIWSVNQFQSHLSLFNGTWQKRQRGVEHRLRFEIEEMQWAVQPVPDKKRLEMVNKTQIEILNSGETLVNCKFKFKLNQNLSWKLYREILRNSNSNKISIWICTASYKGIQIQSKSQFEFVPRDTEELEFLDFD